jgi:hypothetical protein
MKLIGESRQQLDATRLLEMPPVVREYQPPAIQHAVGETGGQETNS